VSTPDDKPPVTWKTISRVADDASAEGAAEVDALASMSDAEIDAQLAAAGFAPDDARKLVGDALAAPAKPAGPVRVSGGVDRPRRPPRASRWPVFAFAAAAVVLGLLFWKRDDVVAFFSPRPEPIGPDREGPVHGPTPGQLEQARFLRAQASGSCADQRWFDCRDELDRAAKLDPAGDTTPQVQALRTAIADAKRAPPAPSGFKLKP
jgi:hypothetical protein